MLNNLFISVDLGASNGRIFTSYISKNKIRIKEIHRFANYNIIYKNSLKWDIKYLFNEIIKGIHKALKHKSESYLIGIDTWGVDYGLLDIKGNLIEPPFSYRDSRTNNIMEKVFELIPPYNLYKLTGIQIIQINTLFQLYSTVINCPQILSKTKDLLFIPDLINYQLTGEKITEYTIATSSQLFNVKKKQWEKEIFSKLNIPSAIVNNVISPGLKIGELKKKFSDKKVNIITVGSHDSASAIAAVPSMSSDYVYISCGTWSLIGIETEKPIINKRTYEYNFTNEGGVFNTIRFLKNVSGLWLLQQCKKIWDKKSFLSYNYITQKIKETKDVSTYIDPDWKMFLNPNNMIEAIISSCKITKQDFENDIIFISKIILQSLALKYRFIIEQIKELNIKHISKIHIVGGGSLNTILCQYTANSTGLAVYAGPSEATVIGNALLLAKYSGLVNSLSEIRSLILNSFVIKEYLPSDTELWEIKYKKFLTLISEYKL